MDRATALFVHLQRFVGEFLANFKNLATSFAFVFVDGHLNDDKLKLVLWFLFGNLGRIVGHNLPLAARPNG